MRVSGGEVVHHQQFRSCAVTHFCRWENTFQHFVECCYGSILRYNNSLDS